MTTIAQQHAANTALAAALLAALPADEVAQINNIDTDEEMHDDTLPCVAEFHDKLLAISPFAYSTVRRNYLSSIGWHAVSGAIWEHRVATKISAAIDAAITSTDTEDEDLYGLEADPADRPSAECMDSDNRVLPRIPGVQVIGFAKELMREVAARTITEQNDWFKAKFGMTPVRYAEHHIPSSAGAGNKAKHLAAVAHAQCKIRNPRTVAEWATELAQPDVQISEALSNAGAKALADIGAARRKLAARTNADAVAKQEREAIYVVDSFTQVAPQTEEEAWAALPLAYSII